MRKKRQGGNNTSESKTKIQLYAESWDQKWNHFREFIGENAKDVFDLCSFCRWVLNHGCVNRLEIDLSGNSDCDLYCLIDKDICGSPKSLMFQLHRAFEKGNIEKERQLIEKIAMEIKKRGDIKS